MGYNVQIDEQDPDLLFFSVDYQKRQERSRYVNHRCKKIFYTGENIPANFFSPGSIEYPNYSIGKSDFAFTFEDSPNLRNYRLPLWVLFINWFSVVDSDNRDPSYLIPLKNLFNRGLSAFMPKSKFCNFVFSNKAGERINILEAISQYKKVDCAGRLANNVGYHISGRGDQKPKIDFVDKYKFTIAAENTKNDGYITEKIIHPLSVGSIPIYWGSESVVKDFNEGCFVNLNKFSTLEDALEHIKMIDNDNEIYANHLLQPVFKDNKLPDFALPKNVLNYFQEVILC